MRTLLPIILLLLNTGIFAQHNDSLRVKQITDEVMRNATAYDNLNFLCKKIGARLSGSPQAQKAVEATAAMLRQAGADTVYLQPCMVPHWVRGEKEQGYIQWGSPEKFNLHLCALGNTSGTGSKGVRSTIVEISNFAQLDSLGKAGYIRGKIVFFNFPMNPTYIESFRAYGESGSSRTRGPSRAAKYGAVAAMVRSLASNPDDYPHTGTVVYNDSFPKIPAVAISTNDARWLSNQIAQKKPLTAFLRTTSAMLPDAPSFNVVGEIRGSEKPGEIITVGGHLDSWDLAEGAQDDGAGVVQSIEIIRALKALGIRPKRTIRAVLFMNEENGGKGAAKYLELAKANGEQHLFALESDAGGFSPRGFSLDMKDTQRSSLLRWKPLFYPYGVYDFDRGGSGSDVGPLKEVGAALAGLRPDSQRYFDIHHAATDTFESVSRRELHLGSAVMAALVWLVSEYGL